MAGPTEELNLFYFISVGLHLNCYMSTALDNVHIECAWESMKELQGGNAPRITCEIRMSAWMEACELELFSGKSEKKVSADS